MVKKFPKNGFCRGLFFLFVCLVLVFFLVFLGGGGQSQMNGQIHKCKKYIKIKNLKKIKKKKSLSRDWRADPPAQCFRSGHI